MPRSKVRCTILILIMSAFCVAECFSWIGVAVVYDQLSWSPDWRGYRRPQINLYDRKTGAKSILMPVWSNY